MNQLLDFQNNDASVISLSYRDDLKITIVAWDNQKYEIEFTDCSTLELNSAMGFEIGNIEVSPCCSSDAEWACLFISENPCYNEYYKIVFYDAWEDKRVNLRLICKDIKICGQN